MAETMTREQHHETKAIIARARQMLNAQVTRQPTLEVMGYTDDHGVHHAGIIPQVHEADWRSGDIARDLYGISAVEGEVQPDLVSHIGDIKKIIGERTGDFVMAAAVGARDVDFAHFAGAPGSMPEGVRGALADSFKAICDLRDQIVEEEMGIGNADLEKEMLGAMRVFGSAKKGVNIGIMQLDIQKGLMALRNNQEKEAGDIAKKYFENIDYDKGNLEKIFSEAQTGIAHFKSAGIPANIKGLDWHEYQGTVRDQRQSQIQAQAEATAATNLHMASLASRVQGNVSSVASNPEALEKLTGEINNLSEAIGKTQSMQTKQFSTNEVQRTIVGYADSRQLAVGQTPIAAVLNDKTFQRSLAREIGRSVGAANATTIKPKPAIINNVTNVTSETEENKPSGENKPPDTPSAPTTTEPPEQ